MISNYSFATRSSADQVSGKRLSDLRRHPRPGQEPPTVLPPITEPELVLRESATEYPDSQKQKKIYSITNDFAFKWIFGQAKHEKNCICLLNALLQLEGENAIRSLTFLNPFNLKEFDLEKSSIVDTKVVDGKGHNYCIEIQLVKDDSFVARTVYYLSKLYADQINSGEPYAILKKATCLSILGFDLFKDSNRIQESFEFRNTHGDLILTDTLALHYLDLTKFNKDKPRSLRTRFEKWLHILKYSQIYAMIEKELDEVFKSEEGIQNVVDEIRKINADAEKRQLMETREKTETCLRLMRGYAYQAGLDQKQKEVDLKQKEVESKQIEIDSLRAELEALKRKQS